MSEKYPHLRPRDSQGRIILDGIDDGWYCMRDGCEQYCRNGELATDCTGYKYTRNDG